MKCNNNNNNKNIIKVRTTLRSIQCIKNKNKKNIQIDSYNTSKYSLHKKGTILTAHK